MTSVPLTTPVRMGKATLTIAADDVTEPISGAEFTSTTPTPWKGIGGKVVGGDAEWTLTITAAQDTAPTGLLRYLLDNAGQQKAIVLTPLAGGPSITAEAALGVPSRIGGSMSSTGIEEFTSTCAVSGQPEFNDAP